MARIALVGLHHEARSRHRAEHHRRGTGEVDTADGHVGAAQGGPRLEVEALDRRSRDVIQLVGGHRSGRSGGGGDGDVDGAGAGRGDGLHLTRVHLTEARCRRAAEGDTGDPTEVLSEDVHGGAPAEWTVLRRDVLDGRKLRLRRVGGRGHARGTERACTQKCDSEYDACCSFHDSTSLLRGSAVRCRWWSVAGASRAPVWPRLPPQLSTTVVVIALQPVGEPPPRHPDVTGPSPARHRSWTTAPLRWRIPAAVADVGTDRPPVTGSPARQCPRSSPREPSSRSVPAQPSNSRRYTLVVPRDARKPQARGLSRGMSLRWHRLRRAHTHCNWRTGLPCRRPSCPDPSSTTWRSHLVRLRAKASCAAVSTARSQYPERTQLTASLGGRPLRMARQASAVPVRPWPP